MIHHILLQSLFYFFFFFNDTATTEIYTLSLHDALPISSRRTGKIVKSSEAAMTGIDARKINAATKEVTPSGKRRDRKSTRLNSSHTVISYAVFCLKKKKKKQKTKRDKQKIV